jgi:hypothetical protein
VTVSFVENRVTASSAPPQGLVARQVPHLGS